MILAERAARIEAEALAARAQAAAVNAEADAAHARADLSSTEALISHYKLEIEKLRRQLYGTRSERTARLLEQMELQPVGRISVSVIRLRSPAAGYGGRRLTRPTSFDHLSKPVGRISASVIRQL